MATLSNAAIFYESAQAQQSFAAMTDSGDHMAFSLATKPWSNAAGYEYAVVPYGLATGGVITPAVAASNNTVDVAAMTLYAPGMTGANATTGLISVGAATSIACTRGSTNGYRITSITVDSTGAVVAVAGTESTAFTETRAAAGGPPLIPVGSVEIGQVRFSATTAAVVAATEIYQVVGTHQERYDFPVWSEDPLLGKIKFASALPLIHTGFVAKKVQARVATPVFAEIPRSKDWKPADTSNSVSSDNFYDGPVGSTSSTVSQASFTASLGDGTTDALLAKAGQILIFKFMPDRNKLPYQLTQGVLGVTRTFAVGANPSGAFTVSASKATVNLAS